MLKSEDVSKLVDAAVAEKRWRDAQELLTTALASAPADWKPLQGDDECIRGAFWDQEEFLTYLAHYGETDQKRILWIGPSYSKMWWQLSIVRAKQDQLEAALECVERGLALEPEQSWLWIEKGNLLSRLGRHEAALDCCTTAVTVRNWASPRVVARALRGQGYSMIELDRLEEARNVYLQSLDLDSESRIAKKELEYINGALKKRGESTPLPWFLYCMKYPAADPLTKQLLALVDGLEPVPGPKAIGAENYARVSAAFFSEGWAGFEQVFDEIVPRDRSDYEAVKRELLREPIFSPTVHSRLARAFLGQAPVDEILRESEDRTPRKSN